MYVKHEDPMVMRLALLARHIRTRTNIIHDVMTLTAHLWRGAVEQHVEDVEASLIGRLTHGT